MGTQVTKTASALITEVRYDLRDTGGAQYTDAELLHYLNRCLEMIHDILVLMRSAWLLSVEEDLTTVAGTESYSTLLYGMGNMLAAHRVWIAGYPPMDLVDESERYGYEQTDGTMQTGLPTMYYLEQKNICFLPVPDDAYTVKAKFFQQFKDIAAIESLPYQNIFNQVVREGIKMMAKHRETYNTGLETALTAMFQQRAEEIERMRTKRTYRLGFA